MTNEILENHTHRRRLLFSATVRLVLTEVARAI